MSIMTRRANEKYLQSGWHALKIINEVELFGWSCIDHVRSGIF